MGACSINIVGLSNKRHLFEYEIDDSFFRQYGSDLLSDGHFQADVVIDKRETFLEAEFSISGTATLTCDRSLETFEYPIHTTNRIVFKYGEADQELTDEIVIIHRDTATLELGQYIYEFIALAIPLKKLHPRFADEPDDPAVGKIVYSSDSDGSAPEADDTVDPRWNALKKLK